MIRVKYYGDVRLLTQRNQEELAADSYQTLLEVLKERYGQDFHRHIQTCIIYLNQEKLDRPEKYAFLNGDEVGFFPPAAGGQK